MEREHEFEEASQLLDPIAGYEETHDESFKSDLIPRFAQAKIHKATRLRRWTILGLVGLVALFTIYGALNLSIQLHNLLSSTTVDPTICDCGSSIEEAKKMGCEYVPLAAAWLPPRCRDVELEEEFDHAGPGPNGEWFYYSDSNGTRKYTREELASFGGIYGDFRIYTSKAWHLYHCVYYWKKQMRLAQTGAIMEPRYGRLAHADHCLSEFMDTMNRRLIASVQQISLASSVPKEKLDM